MRLERMQGAYRHAMKMATGSTPTGTARCCFRRGAFGGLWWVADGMRFGKGAVTGPCERLRPILLHRFLA